jgi:post-segregation antitoxin (ccd killing protein)
MGKKARTTLTIDKDVLQKAKEIGLNISQFCENALKEAIETLEQRKSKTNPEGDVPNSKSFDEPFPKRFVVARERLELSSAGPEPAMLAATPPGFQRNLMLLSP